MEVGEVIGNLLLEEKFNIGKRVYWNCKCNLCGKEKSIRDDSLKSGKTISCGCYKTSKEFSSKMKSLHQIEDLTGKKYSSLTVLGLSEKRVGKKILWMCQCDCGEIVEVWSANLKNGNTKTCGGLAHRIKHLKSMWENTLDDLTGQVFGDWLVLYRDGETQPTRWICKCKNCGTIKSVLGNALKNGSSKSDGCRKRNDSLEGCKIGHWLVGTRSQRLRPNGHHCTTYLCLCDCGVQRYVDETRLLSGKSLSCGCVKSIANERITKWLIANKISFKTEYSYPELVGPGGGNLRFDFAILNNRKVNFLIEFQGQQHYIDTDFGREQREITDPLKRKYCKENNIQLFEIKYTDDIEKELSNIISTHYMPIPCQAQ